MKKNQIRKPELIQFVRGKGKLVKCIDEKGNSFAIREKGSPRGIVVAGMVNGKVKIGWSYVNKKLGDSFDKQLGLQIAMNRMVSPSPIDKIPHSVMKTLDNGFYSRCEKYFGVSLD